MSTLIEATGPRGHARRAPGALRRRPGAAPGRDRHRSSGRTARARRTLLRLLIGAERPDEGRIVRAPGAAHRLRAAEARGRPDAADHRRRLPRARRRRRRRHGRQALERVGIAGLGRRQLAALSGGQFQRALLAQALLRRPELLVLDEAAQGLDQPGEARFYRLIEQIRARARLRRADGEPRPARGDGGVGPGDLPQRARLLRGHADGGLGRARVPGALRPRHPGRAGALPARPRPRAWRRGACPRRHDDGHDHGHDTTHGRAHGGGIAS